MYEIMEKYVESSNFDGDLYGLTCRIPNVCVAWITNSENFVRGHPLSD